MPTLDVPALLDALTLEEKAHLVTGADFWHTHAVERLGIPSVLLADGPHGLRTAADDHLGLSAAEPATCFPPAVALGSTWNTALVREVGHAIGTEARAKSVGVVLGPGINIKRSPLCGRNFEYVSEDPHVAGEFAVAMIDGIQSQGAGTSVKHYAVNNQETDRLRVSSEVDERTLREIYLPAFERAVAARPWTVMASYNRVNGEWVSQSHRLLTEILRDEWGYDGVVVSDWGAVVDRVEALRAGLDLEMPGHPSVTPAAVVAAVEDGRLSPDTLDEAVRRVLELVDRALPGLDEPLPVDEQTQHEVARRAALEAPVLLSNDGALPIDRTARIAVVGELARTPRFQGAGSSQVNATRVVSPLDALREAADDVTFAAGYTLDGADEVDRALLDEAVTVAQDADVVVLFVGLPQSYESEGFDRAHIDLPADQSALVEAIAAAAPKVVVVLSNGSAVTIPWHDSVSAVLEAWLLGQAGGQALAAILLGDVSPSGRLTETIPLRLEDNPSYGSFPGELGHARYGEGVLVGYRGYDARGLDVAFPFGHGLTYSEFTYSDVSVRLLDEQITAEAMEAVVVSLTVTNTGSVDAAEVVQVYVSDPQAAVLRPPRELKRFEKVALAAGESREVHFTLNARDLAYWHPVQARWVVEAGDFVIGVGASSRDIRGEQTVTVTQGDVIDPTLDADSTYAEWMADATGRPLLDDAMAEAGKQLVDVEVVGSFPLRRLTAFGAMSLSADELDALVARYDAARADERS